MFVQYAFLPIYRFFDYDWRKEIWNLLFVLGIAIGAFVATYLFTNPNPVEISKRQLHALQS
jgi:hypothetical protein